MPFGRFQAGMASASCVPAGICLPRLRKKGLGVLLKLLKLDVCGRCRKWMTEVDFASNEIWRGLPLMLGGIANFKLDFWRLRFLKFLSFIEEPVEVLAGVIDHFFG